MLPAPSPLAAVLTPSPAAAEDAALDSGEQALPFLFAMVDAGPVRWP